MLSDPVEPVMQREYEDQVQDDDSLFGSPPPSPSARGRSPSPTLALPTASSAGLQILSPGSSAQNVGTIALPGSHAHSEPSINPIAVSLSLPGGSYTPLLPRSLPSSEPQSRQGSIGCHSPARPILQPRPHSSAGTQQKAAPTRRRAPKRKWQEPTPCPPPPEISLPNPSQPPPAHFLRNQQALLGHAGLIARVKPSKLILSGAPRGASPSNPIVLDDREAELSPESPAIGRSHLDYLKSLDLSKLPAPTNQEIVEMLIKQRDIFPVLQSILKLLATGALGGTAVAPPSIPVTRPRMSGSNKGRALFHPPLKRRKLNRVPAGAADWDVPYPFQDGEGPEAYEQTWLKERGRELISQLINLVKIAARKAAAKKHLGELQETPPGFSESREPHVRDGTGTRKSESQGGRGANHYRDVNRTNRSPTTTPQISPQEGEIMTRTSPDLQNVPTGALQPVMDSERSVASQHTNPTSSITSFNDLFSALLAASDASPTPSANALSLSALQPSEPSVPSEAASSPHSSFDLSSLMDGNTDQSLIDSWMNILQTFPLQVEGSPAGDMPSSDHVTLEPLLGSNSPSTSSSPTSDDSSFSTTPNPDAQQAQNFTPLDLSQLGDLDFALRLVAGGVSTPDVHGRVPPSMGGTPLPVDFNFGPPPSSREYSKPTQEHTSALDQPSSTIITDQPSTAQSPTAAEVQTSNSFVTTLSTELASIDLDNLIDPQLLALSQPTSSASLATFPKASSGTAAQDSTLPPLANNVSSPSSSLASPLSPPGPTTPSSAGWDIGIPEVVAGESNIDAGGVDLAGKSHGQGHEGAERPELSDVQRGTSRNKLSERNSHVTTHKTQITSKRTTQSSPPASSAPLQPAGVFQVLRATDWQPRQPVRKLKKTDVLKKAEEKREELRAKLEKVKVKLWETTIEHGALLHLMRLPTDSEEVPSSSSLGP